MQLSAIKASLSPRVARLSAEMEKMTVVQDRDPVPPFAFTLPACRM